MSHRQASMRTRVYPPPTNAPHGDASVRTAHTVGSEQSAFNSTPNTAHEAPEHRSRQRSKQIHFGKVTQGYRNYRVAVPTFSRQPDNPRHPTTPDVQSHCSKRQWDSQVSTWRRALHEWDGAPSPRCMALAHLPTREQLGLEPQMPLETYHRRTMDELDRVQIHVRGLVCSGDSDPDGPHTHHPSAAEAAPHRAAAGVDVRIVRQASGEVLTVTLVQAEASYIREKLTAVADLDELCWSPDGSTFAALSNAQVIERLRLQLTTARASPHGGSPIVLYIPAPAQRAATPSASVDELTSLANVPTAEMEALQAAPHDDLSPNGYLESQAMLASGLVFTLKTPLGAQSR